VTTLRSLAPVGTSPGSDRNLLVTWLGPIGMGLALAGIAGARWFATIRGFDALGVGALFGLALVAMWLIAARSRLDRDLTVLGNTRSVDVRQVGMAVAAGIAFGLALVVLAVVGAAVGGSPVVGGLSRPAAPFLPWAVITVAVAAGEEGVLRGVLFDRLRAAGGTSAAIVITTIAFALIHVPLYGWHVVPLDLAVGLGFAGLRLSTRTVLAPVVAHAVADLATWWL
jgi:membrane protease YdiL (CAAX protease family)